MPDVVGMVREYLVRHGYGGLVSGNGPCGCLLGDLAPCMDGPCSDCEAGYKVAFPDGGCSCGEGCCFHIVSGRPKMVRLTQRVASEIPFAGLAADPGTYEAMSNDWGAISIKVGDRWLGVKPGEFEPVEP